MSYIDAIKNRHSVRNYETTPIEQSKTDRIKELI